MTNLQSKLEELKGRLLTSSDRETVEQALIKLRVDEQIRIQAPEVNEIVNRLSIFAEQLSDCAEVGDTVDDMIEVEDAVSDEELV